MNTMKKQLFKRKEDAAKAAKEDEAIQKIINSSEMDIPDPMIDMQCENMIQEFESRINQQGLTLEQYMQFSGATIDKMKENLRPEAVQRIQSSLVLEQIANEENIEVKQEEVDEQIQKVASAYGLTGEKMKEIMSDDDKESIEKNLSIEKAVNLIMEHTVEVEETEEKTETEEKAEEA